MFNILLGMTIFLSLYTVVGIILLVYPGDPKPVPEGEIEDAVIVYTWAEAFALKTEYLRFLYALVLVTALMYFS